MTKPSQHVVSRSRGALPECATLHELPLPHHSHLFLRAHDPAVATANLASGCFAQVSVPAQGRAPVDLPLLDHPNRVTLKPDGSVTQTKHVLPPVRHA